MRAKLVRLTDELAEYVDAQGVYHVCVGAHCAIRRALERHGIHAPQCVHPTTWENKQPEGGPCARP